MESTADPRDRVLASYQATIERAFLENRSQLKLINYGTGSGKTHMLFKAICEAIREHFSTRLIGIYVAPLREHLQIPEIVSQEYVDIPVYKAQSLEMKTSDENLNCYKEWIPSILSNLDFWRLNPKQFSSEQIQEVRRNLGSVKGIINQIELLKRSYINDDKLRDNLILDARRRLDDTIEKFLEFVVRNKGDETAWPEECLELAEIFFPLHLLRDKSGIIMLTYKKLETAIPYFEISGGTWIKRKLALPEYAKLKQAQNGNLKFIFALDEQEDGYQIMLDSKIDIIYPQELAINNALASINREFSALFSRLGKQNREFLKFLEDNEGAYDEFEEHYEKNKKIDDELQEFYKVYLRMVAKDGNSRNFLDQLMKINKSLEDSLKVISSYFEDSSEEKPVALEFQTLSRVFSIFENNRSLLIPYALFNKIKDDLMNIFSYNNLYIYNIEPLKKLFLTKSSGGHVFITDQKTQENISVAELIYAILSLRIQIQLIQKLLGEVLESQDSQSRSLDVWSRQVSRVQKASGEQTVTNPKLNKYLNRHYVYESYKSIINIMEISRYQHPSNNLINYEQREVSIGSTAILTSPEFLINSMLGKNNMVFLISATGGITGDLSTSYDMTYLEDSLRNELGVSTFEVMTPEEVLLCREIRENRQTQRQVSVAFFDSGGGVYPNVATKGAVDNFRAYILKGFIQSLRNQGGWLGQYKVQELNNFIHFLFYLFEDDSIQEMLAFTQTLGWIKALITDWQRLKNRDFLVESSEEHPGIYYIQIKNPKTYKNLRVKLILYDAQFDHRYYDKALERSYLSELLEEPSQKIFFISAYQSASKGLNPYITTIYGGQKDFDSLVLLMDSYYSVMKPRIRRVNTPEASENPGRAETRYHFALMKNIVTKGDTTFEIKDFNKYLSRPESQEFRLQQHQILLGKGILQAIGRTERRNKPDQLIKIFVNEETRRNLVDFYRYLGREEPLEIEKLSVNNFEVYSKVQAEEQSRIIHDYDEHIQRETQAHIAIQEFRESMLNKITAFHEDRSNFNIVKAWEVLRDPIVFKNPAAYLKKLRETGYFPNDFIDSLFYSSSERPAFTPYLASIEVNGRKIRVLSDSANGESIYTFQSRLYPDNLKRGTKIDDTEDSAPLPPDKSTENIHTLFNRLIPQPAVFDKFIPRPNFFYDVLYPSLAENFVALWVKDVIFQRQDWKAIKAKYDGFQPLQNFRKYNKLYERFDLFYIKRDELICIDVKAWSRQSGDRLSQETLEKSQTKLNRILVDYPEFKIVKGLLLNLHAPREKSVKHSLTLFSGNLIFFDDFQFPVASRILDNFLFSKEI